MVNASLSTILRNTRIILISLAAGSIDAISYLGLGHVFTANMTGNTVLLALSLSGQGGGLSAFRSGISLIGFALGCLASAFFVSLQIEKRRQLTREIKEVVDRSKHQDEAEKWPSEVNTALYVETAILIVYGAIWSTSFNQTSLDLPIAYVLIFFSALAMGIQSVAISHLGVWGVVTTYITGTYTSFLTGVVKKSSRVVPFVKRAKEQKTTVTGEKEANLGSERSLRLEAVSLVAFGFGAGVGGVLIVENHFIAPWLPIVAVAIAATLSLVRS
jgi:uncharacterized membrane protein YoaK (UPF0700 family)